MNLSLEMQEALQLFIVECQELLQDMEINLLELEQQDDANDSINAIFRAAHTIKGSAGLFGLEHIVQFTHVVESVLDELRSGNLSVSADLIALLLPCRDHIEDLINTLADGDISGVNDTHQARSNALIEKLRFFLNAESAGEVVKSATAFATATPSEGSNLESGNWHLSLRFGPDSLRDGMDPLSFIRYLSKLGDIVYITTITDALLPAEEFDAETCYLGFEIDLKTQADKEIIEGVFDFVRDSSIIKILPPDSRLTDYLNLIQDLPEDDMFLGQLLIHSGMITRRELEEGLKQQRNDTTEGDTGKPIGAILVEQEAVKRPLVDAALEKQKQGREQKARENQSIRVDAERLDYLIDLVGELIIACATANVCAADIQNERLQEANTEVGLLVEQVRDSALQLRMVPIGTTFSRFQRVVREVSAELGKDIALVINGGETEVDKSVAEKIGDPLTHLVRNAMDHGIETAEARIAAGKPAQGTLQLNAYHDSGSIVIEVSDDGGGLKRDKILAKAIERGLIQANTNLSEQEIYALIFEPGFSTADQVSNLSGRGVGMDVVKRNITALRGTIDILSNPGTGTTLRIYLPLTLAIIDGFQVSVGESFFVIPLNPIIVCVARAEASSKYHYMDLRGEVLPLISLKQIFSIPAIKSERQNVVVIEHAGHKCGIIVDHLLGEIQTVIKPLSDLFAHLIGVGGSTILGSGDIALILDVAGLMSLEAEGSHKQMLPDPKNLKFGDVHELSRD